MHAHAAAATTRVAQTAGPAVQEEEGGGVCIRWQQQRGALCASQKVMCSVNALQMQYECHLMAAQGDGMPGSVVELYDL